MSARRSVCGNRAITLALLPARTWQQTRQQPGLALPRRARNRRSGGGAGIGARWGRLRIYEGAERQLRETNSSIYLTILGGRRIRGGGRPAP